MRTIIVPAFALLLAACSGEAPHPLAPDVTRPAAAVLANTRTPINIPRYFNLCTQEYVNLSATVHRVIAVTRDGAGGFHTKVHVDVTFSGVGETSGTEYVGMQVTNLSFQAQPPFPSTRTLVTTVRVIGKGVADNLLATVHTHITVNADGEVTSQFAVNEITCQ